MPKSNTKNGLIPIDEAKAKRDLNLSQQATLAGQKGNISLTDTSRDNIAFSIDSYINDVVTRTHEYYLERIQSIETLIRNVKVPTEGGLTNISNEYEGELHRTRANYEIEVRNAKGESNLADQALDEFRLENNLVRVADLPEGLWKTLGIAFLFAVFEIIINAYVLGNAHPEGPVGVAVEIFMFTFVNVTVALIFGGPILRMFNYKSNLKKTFAFILALPSVLFLLFLNFFLAHYRDAIVKLAEKLTNSSAENLNGTDINAAILNIGESLQALGRQALESLMASPFGLDDFKSFVLLFAGLTIAGITALKSYSSTDPFPKYGNMAQKANDAQENYREVKNEALEKVHDLQNKLQREVDGKIALAQACVAGITRDKNEREQFHQNYIKWLKVTQSTGESLYAFYRAKFINASSSNEEPKSFSMNKFEISINPNTINLESIQVDTINVSKLEKQATKCKNEFSASINSYRNFIEGI